MAAKASYQNAQIDVELLTGIRVSAKTQERIVARNPIADAGVSEKVDELALDGGMVRLVTPKGEPSEWKQYKAVRVNGNDMGMAWFQADSSLLNWVETLCLAAVLYCLGDGYAGVWSLYQQMGRDTQRDEILDWFHLNENLHKVGGSLKRIKQAEALLWEGKVEEASELFRGLKSKQAKRFRAYLAGHRSRIPNYHYYQMEGLPIGSGPVESLIKQIDSRIQVTGAQWKPDNVSQILALRCSYLNQQLNLHSLARG